MSSAIADAPLPVTLLGGYLGSGKTTLVNHLLRHSDGLKLAVLVNEFGELPIDADLIEAQDDDLISIAGGCICCSYGDDMLEGIQRLRDMDTRPDHLIIESSGVAMPQAIAAAMSLVRGISLHTIAVIADAETLYERSRDRYMGDTITRQLNSADLLILNRCDLATDEQKQRAVEVLQEHSPECVIIEAHFATVPVAVLLDRQGSADVKHNAADTGLPHAKFASVFIECPDSLEVKALGNRLSTECPGLVRAKGFVVDSTSGATCVVQLSGKRVRITPLKEDIPVKSNASIENATARRLGIVLIGVLPLFNSDVATLREQFNPKDKTQ